MLDRPAVLAASHHVTWSPAKAAQKQAAPVRHVHAHVHAACRPPPLPTALCLNHHASGIQNQTVALQRPAPACCVLLQLEESAGDLERVRDVYERAVAQLPPGHEKRFWRRYIYMWVKYALFEELEAGDTARARDVYRAVLDLVPHQLFTFAKLWVLAAKFEVRQKNVAGARRLLGQALGRCPKDRLFRDYIELEMTMGNIDRCRVLYEKYLEFNPANVAAWLKWADLEHSLSEADRCRWGRGACGCGCGA